MQYILGMFGRTLAPHQQAQLDGFIVTDDTTGSALFGKARFPPNPLHLFSFQTLILKLDL